MVFEVRQHGGRDVGSSWWGERRADCKDCLDELRVVQRDAEDDGSAPVMAAKDDGGDGELGG